MKTILSILITTITLLYSSSSYSEKYNCSYMFKSQPMSFSLERQSNDQFVQFLPQGEFPQKTLYENDQYLILGILTTFTDTSGYVVTFIDKKIKIFKGYSIFEPSDKKNNSELIQGKCMTY